MAWKVTLNGTRRQLTQEELTDPYASIWEGGTVVDFDDLPQETFDQLSRQEPEGGATWWGVYKFPKGEAGRMCRVIEACAKHAGIDPPSHPTTMRATCALMALIEPTQDIEDKPFVNGFPQTPAGTENGSSSGPSVDSAGQNPSPEQPE